MSWELQLCPVVGEGKTFPADFIFAESFNNDRVLRLEVCAKHPNIQEGRFGGDIVIMGPFATITILWDLPSEFTTM